MDFNLLTNIEICQQFKSEAPLMLVYYSHVPEVFIALLVGFFIFVRNREKLIGKILLSISLVFSFWAILDLTIWIFGYNSAITTFSWSLLNLFHVLLFILSLYFVYVFIDKKDVSLKIKIILASFLLPLIFLTPTRFNISEFNASTCEAVSTNFISDYTSAVGLVISIWIVVLAFIRYKSVEKIFREQLVLLTVGILLFLLAFSWSDIFGNITLQWDISQYGLFGMPIFMGFLAYLIVKYKAFNIKMIGVQALVTALFILVGSQFFFAQDSSSIVLTGVTLALTLGFGYVLIKSVNEEIAQKEALQIANKEITERKEQLQIMADRLAIANDQLRKLDNAKTEFISIASHQLRTPITAIKGFVSLILEGSYGEINGNVQGALEKVYASSERLIELVEELLNVSRIESGRMTFVFEKANPKKLLKELYDNFLLVAKTKKFYFELKLPEVPLPEIMMDCSKIRELVSNFIDNALKYTEKGGINIKAEIKEEGVIVDENGFVIPGAKSEFGKMLRITVSDTGIGIPKEEVPYLFKKFSRGKDVARLHVGGTGLGLYVGKAIAENHHGQVWVESDGSGKGSRFIIEIPLEAELGS